MDGRLSPVPGRLVQKIQRGDYIDMAELLRDNMELERQQASHETTSANLGLRDQPSRREVSDLIPWVQCFGVYAAVKPDGARAEDDRHTMPCSASRKPSHHRSTGADDDSRSRHKGTKVRYS